MKKKNRILYLCAALFVMTVIGGLLYAPPALAWDTWPAATNNDINHTWTVVFDQAMNTETMNSENIYVSNDITGSSIVSGVNVRASDSTHTLVAPPAGGWSSDTNYYLIITQKVLTGTGMPLKDEVRMPFRIVIETKATPTIDVTNDGVNITVKVNGNQLSFDQPPYIANGSTMVPFRTIAEALGAEVDWDQASQKITIMGDKTVELTVNSKTARVNGTAVTLDNPAVVTGGRTMVPLRFVGEAMGAKVSYTSTKSPSSDVGNIGSNTTENVINILGGSRIEFRITHNVNEVILENIKNDLTQKAQILGFEKTAIYQKGTNMIILDIVGESINSQQIIEMLNTGVPLELASNDIIPPQIKGINVVNGITLAPGLRTEFELAWLQGDVNNQEILNSTILLLHNRAQSLGYSDVQVYQIGTDRIVIDMGSDEHQDLERDLALLIDSNSLSRPLSVMSKNIIHP